MNIFSTLLLLSSSARIDFLQFSILLIHVLGLRYEPFLLDILFSSKIFLFFISSSFIVSLSLLLLFSQKIWYGEKWVVGWLARVWKEPRVEGWWVTFFYILESFNKPTNVHCGGALMSSEEAGNEFHIFGTTRLDLTRPSGKEKLEANSYGGVARLFQVE